MDDRAVTETLGTVLLLALVVILATTIGLGLLTQTSAIQDGTERSYLNVDPNLNESALTLTHAGGPSFQTSGLTLVLQNEAGREEFELDDSSLTRSGLDDGSFETGDSVTVPHGFTGYVDISLYSSETNERLYRAVLSTDQSDISTPAGGSGPTAQISTFDRVAEGYNITLDGSESTDADGSIVRYSWTITNGSGTIVEDDTATPNATYEAPADVPEDENVTVELTVEDDDGNTDTTTTTITVVDTDTAEAPEDADGDGSAFNDSNGNGVYDEGEDIVSKEELEDKDGYSDPDGDLVIYASVGEVRVDGGSVNISAETITAGSNFEANGEEIKLTAEGDIRIDDTTLEANSGGNITITSTNGRIFANRTVMSVNKGAIDLNSNGSIYLESADLDAGSYSADLTATSSTLYVDDAEIGGNNNAGTLFYDPDGITVNGTPSRGSVSS